MEDRIAGIIKFRYRNIRNIRNIRKCLEIFVNLIALYCKYMFYQLSESVTLLLYLVNRNDSQI